MKIPTRSDWGVIEKNNLDAECAFRQFSGKSLNEAEMMFRNNALYYQEDLISMPPVAFNFYAPAFARYILSDNAEADSDGASSFLHMVLELLQSNRSLTTTKTEKMLLASAQIVASKQEFYAADTDIYGDFPELYKQIMRLAAPT